MFQSSKVCSKSCVFQGDRAKWDQPGELGPTLCQGNPSNISHAHRFMDSEADTPAKSLDGERARNIALIQTFVNGIGIGAEIQRVREEKAALQAARKRPRKEAAAPVEPRRSQRVAAVAAAVAKAKPMSQAGENAGAMTGAEAPGGSGGLVRRNSLAPFRLCGRGGSTDACSYAPACLQGSSKESAGRGRQWTAKERAVAQEVGISQRDNRRRLPACVCRLACWQQPDPVQPGLPEGVRQTREAPEARGLEARGPV